MNIVTALLLCLLSLTTNNGFILRGIFRTYKNHNINKNININSDSFIETRQPAAVALQTVEEAENKYNLNWYVIGEAKRMKNNVLNRITVWNRDYVFWKNNDNYYAMDDDCSHKGASLSRGRLINNNVMCPYHGYEFNTNGVLCKVPGLNFTNTPCQNQNTYNIVEKNGWIYMNTVSNILYSPQKISIFEEDEARNSSLSRIFINMPFKTYGRVLTENSLDVMHIGFVHTFGNKQSPSPTKEVPPYLVGDYPYHYKTEYDYTSGKDSIAKKVFGFKQLKIENEFALPHTTIARVKFGEFFSTIVTFASPINVTHSTLFVKTYRNFWNSKECDTFSKLYNWIGDRVTTEMMIATVLQDKGIIENIKLEHSDGKFNMKFDKLQNVYKTLYKKLVHNITLTKV
jgi:phenylpropionate dioxygenase-like ring-hydroxylating dioxygenase large terminal subunit